MGNPIRNRWNELGEVQVDLNNLLETEIPDLEADLEAAGARRTPGRKLPRP